MKSINILLLTGILISPLLEATQSKSYEQPTNNYQKTKNNITVKAHIISKDEALELYRDSGKTFKKSKLKTMIPIKLQVTNHGDNSVFLNENDINLPSETLAQKLSFFNITKIALLSYFSCAIFLLLSSFLLIGTVYLVCFSLIYPFLSFLCFLGIWAVAANYGYRFIKNMITGTKKTIITSVQQLMIKPYETQESIVFVSRKQFKNNFNLIIVDSENNPTDFSVAL